MKKLISALAALVLGASLLTVPAFAADSSIQTYGDFCTECNRGEIVLNRSHDMPWYIVDSFDCPRRLGMVDILRERAHYTTWKCTYCGYSMELSTTEQELLCNH